MIDNIYDKTSKISFSVYGDDFLVYFGEYQKIIRELGTEIDTLYGKHKRLDKLVLVDDDTLQNWEFLYKAIAEDNLRNYWDYNKLKSAETGKIIDSFIISFANPKNCNESVKIGRSICFAPIIKYLQEMGLHKRLNIIETKVNDNIEISIHDELTLIFVTLATKDADKEKVIIRVCGVLDRIDYIPNPRRIVIDSLIAFQIENFVKSKKIKDELNEVVDMQLSVEELFVQVEREAEYDKGYDHGFDEGHDKGFDEGRDKGFDEGQDEIILNMLAKSVSDEVIREYTGCSLEHIRGIKESLSSK